MFEKKDKSDKPVKEKKVKEPKPKKVAKKKSKKIDNPYFDLRGQILDMEPTSLMREMMGSHPIHAAVVDMAMGDVVVTLTCVADGTTSLYFSGGGMQIGLGHASEDVKNATLTFLHSADQVLDLMTVVEEYVLPEDEKHIVYLAANDCVYAQEFDLSVLSQMPNELQFLNYLYQSVLTKIGEYNQANNISE